MSQHLPSSTSSIVIHSLIEEKSYSGGKHTAKSKRQTVIFKLPARAMNLHNVYS